jgi:FMN phosphatase YigB (HAD superfamily)
MIKIEATDPEIALIVLRKIQSWAPYKYGGIKFIRKFDDKFYSCYVKKPKPNDQSLYQIVKKG